MRLLDDAVDGFGAGVADSSGVEVRQVLSAPRAQHPAQTGDLGGWAPRGNERVDDRLGDPRPAWGRRGSRAQLLLPASASRRAVRIWMGRSASPGGFMPLHPVEQGLPLGRIATRIGQEVDRCLAGTGVRDALVVRRPVEDDIELRGGQQGRWLPCRPGASRAARLCAQGHRRRAEPGAPGHSSPTVQQPTTR